MLAAKVRENEAENAKKKLAEKGLLDSRFRVRREQGYVLIPVKEREKLPWEVVEAELEPAREKTGLKKALKNKMSGRELAALKTAFDTVGSVAILEIDEELRGKEKLIAETLLGINPSIKTVLRKDAKHEGVFRTQKLKWLAGKKTKKAVHRENSVVLALELEKVYFSPRLSNERKRIAEQVRKGENVLVMFSGCGPYTCVIAKNAEAKKVVGVEINPVAHKYAEINKEKNRLRNVENYLGDAREVVPALKERFDRVVMPLPVGAESFLDVALKAAKPNAVIHFYDFLEEKDIPQAAVKKVRKACPKAKILRVVRCGQFAPRTYRVCVDFVAL